MGVPVVSMNVGDIQNVVIDGKTGYIVEQYDDIKYAEKVKMVLQNGKEYYMEECKNMALNYTPIKMKKAIDGVFIDV